MAHLLFFPTTLPAAAVACDGTWPRGSERSAAGSRATASSAGGSTSAGAGSSRARNRTAHAGGVTCASGRPMARPLARDRKLPRQVDSLKLDSPTVIALFPNPTARHPERRWIANALRDEWSQAAAKVGLRGRMYAGAKHSSARAWLAQGSSLQMIRRMLRHADSRSTERYGKLADLALVDVIRPRARRDVDPMWIQARTRRASPSDHNGIWRGGRDSNPQLPA